MKINEEDFNAILKCLERHVSVYKFHNEGQEPSYIEDMLDIVEDIRKASEKGEKSVFVDVDVMKSLAEMGVFSEAEEC